MASSFYKHNRDKLRAICAPHKLIIVTGHRMVQASADTALPFVQDSSFFYLTGLEEPGLTLVIDGTDEYLIVSDFDEVRAAFEGEVDHSKLTEISGVSRIITDTKAWEILRQRIPQEDVVATLEPLHVYDERHEMFANPSRQYLIDRIKAVKSDIEFFDARPELARARMIKTDYEIRMIEQAIAYTKELFSIIESERGTVENERDLHAAITAHRMKQGLENAYEPIIAGGTNAVTLHYVQNNQPLHAGELLLLDIGLKFQGYSADITRTVVTDPSARQQEVYDAVLAVQQFALTLLKPGTDFRVYEIAVRDYMGTKLRELGLITDMSPEAVRKYYPHSTSHFLGIDVHDVGDYRVPLEAGVVLTVEPGIYIPEEGIGIRIEDDVLITDDGNRVLSSNLPKNIRSLTIEA